MYNNNNAGKSKYWQWKRAPPDALFIIREYFVILVAFFLFSFSILFHVLTSVTCPICMNNNYKHSITTHTKKRIYLGFFLSLTVKHLSCLNGYRILHDQYSMSWIFNLRCFFLSLSPSLFGFYWIQIAPHIELNNTVVPNIIRKTLLHQNAQSFWWILNCWK